MEGDRIGILKAKSIGEAQGYIKEVEEWNETDVTNNRPKNVQQNTFQNSFHCIAITLSYKRQGRKMGNLLPRLFTTRKSGYPV
jgi:hypothetical protein